jgi:hypothetical protein
MYLKPARETVAVDRVGSVNGVEEEVDEESLECGHL